MRAFSKLENVGFMAKKGREKNMFFFSLVKLLFYFFLFFLFFLFDLMIFFLGSLGLDVLSLCFFGAQKLWP
jgi:hypothetical protein